MNEKRAFTLVELLIVVVILGILAAVIVPSLSGAADGSREAASAIIVKSLRKQISIVKMQTGTYPASISTSWFDDGMLPRNPFDPDASVTVQIDPTAAKRHPGTKTVHVAGAFWYNPTNGCLRARIIACDTDPETIARYNAANACNVTTLGQTD